MIFGKLTRSHNLIAEKNRRKREYAPAAKVKSGKEHARNERHAWYLHLLACTIGCALLFGIILWIEDESRTESLLKVIRLWSLVLGIDFLVSFSYTLWPRKGKKPVDLG